MRPPIRSACKLVQEPQAHTWKYEYVISAKTSELLAEKRTANVRRYSCFQTEAAEQILADCWAIRFQQLAPKSEENLKIKEIPRAIC